MIYIGILDTSGLCPSESCVISKIPEEVRVRVEKTRDAAEKAMRAGAYMLLPEIYKRLLNKKMPCVIYTGRGKPIFENNENENETLHNIRFSISHDGNLSVVAMTCADLDVGVDVQTTSLRNINYDKISKHFWEHIPALQEKASVGSAQCSFNLKDTSVKIICFVFKNGNLFEVPHDAFFSPEDYKGDDKTEFLAKWTIFESALKASGGGFGDITSVKKIIKEMSSRTISFVRNKRKYLLSISLMSTK